MKTTRIAACVLFCMTGILTAQQTPDGLQFNVPYICNDGHTYVVHKCEKGPKFEACFYQREQDSERYNTREAVVYQMTKMCKVQGQPAGASAAAQAGSTPLPGVYHCTNGYTLTISKCDKWNGADACLFKVENKGQVLMDSPGSVTGVAKMLRACNGEISVLQSATSPPDGLSPAPSSSGSRAMDPAYLADMPSVDRVKNEIKGSDPTETRARQVAVFTYLGQYIQRIKTNRSVRSPYTPDEQSVLNAYNLASYQITQDYGKSHTPAEANAFQSLHWKYEMGDADQWAKQLMGKQSSAAYNGAMKDLSATATAHYDEEMRTYQDATARQKARNNQAGGADDHYAKDAPSVAARHCLESGRSEMECLGVALKAGAKDLVGGDSLEGPVLETPPGLRLTGLYSAGNFGLRFQQDTVSVGCGTLVPQSLPYSVERTSNQILVKIPLAPRPLALSYKLDGNLAGPGPLDVAGRVWVAGAVETLPNGWTHRDEMGTTPKTERCNVGMLPPAGEYASVSGVLTQAIGSKASKSANTAPGLRLNGTYAVPGGLKIEFRGDSATLECGESFSSEAYSLHWEGSQLMINFQNSAGPLSLVLQPNGTLTGSGDVDVAGRKAIQATGGGVDYLPRNARCSLGTLEAAK